MLRGSVTLSKTQMLQSHSSAILRELVLHASVSPYGSKTPAAVGPSYPDVATSGQRRYHFFLMSLFKIKESFPLKPPEHLASLSYGQNYVTCPDFHQSHREWNHLTSVGQSEHLPSSIPPRGRGRCQNEVEAMLSRSWVSGGFSRQATASATRGQAWPV